MSLNQKITIAVDVMSGDKGSEELIPAIISVAQNNANITLIAVGQEDKLTAQLSGHQLFKDGRIQIQNATQVVEMDEQPQSALKNKKDSSMRVAINLVKDGSASACVSAGNTGAVAHGSASGQQLRHHHTAQLYHHQCRHHQLSGDPRGQLEQVAMAGCSAQCRPGFRPAGNLRQLRLGADHPVRAPGAHR